MARISFSPFLLVLLASSPALLYAFGFRLAVVLTDSMEPTVPKWSLVVAAPTWLREPRAGDVALYRLKLERGEWLVVHRVVGATEEGYCTKGDNRQFTDPWVVRKEDVVGTLILSIPFIGFPLLASRMLAPIVAGWLAYLATRELVAGEG